jgi:hypothetical protein
VSICSLAEEHTIYSARSKPTTDLVVSMDEQFSSMLTARVTRSARKKGAGARLLVVLKGMLT